MNDTQAIEVAVLAPVRQCFDYLAPPGQTAETLRGCRVRVPFGRGERIGIVLGPGNGGSRELKPVHALLDAAPLVPPELLGLARWAADYYCHPPGEALASVFPLALRRGQAPRSELETHWTLAPAGLQALRDEPRLGPRQRLLLADAAAGGLCDTTLARFDFDARRVLRGLAERGWVEARQGEPPTIPEAAPKEAFLNLNPGQRAALESVLATRDRYSPWLLQGVTGSGKTEVYLHLAQAMAGSGRQTLVLIPEIGLSEQLVQRFRRRFGAAVALLHSDLGDRERSLAWERCRSGRAQVLIGTRSAVWASLPTLGAIVVDEEHDPSFKQEEGFRYHARDVAVMRAQRAGVPVVLGTATPSLESEANAVKGKYGRLRLPGRAGGASAPVMRGVDVRGLRLDGGLSAPLCTAIERCLARGEQALLFINRRGYAPLVMCHACGWIAGCARCDARLVLHHAAGRLDCHHCGASRRVDDPRHRCCAEQSLFTLGLGTEQVEVAVRDRFPQARVARIDRDTMRRKGQLEAVYEAVARREVDILLGTQMIAKGHDFPGITLVGVVDADSRLFAQDFRAAERFAQTMVQVAGRAGRGAEPGQVLVQTHHPHHPWFERVLQQDYPAFAAAALLEREEAGLPPAVALASVRAEAHARELPLRFLQGLKRSLGQRAQVDIAGPVPSPMERKAGKYRAALLLTSPSRGSLGQALQHLLEHAKSLPEVHRVRWHVDVDPQDAG